MRDQGNRGGRGRGRTSPTSTDSQTPTSGRIGGRYGTPSSSDRPRGGRLASRGGRGGHSPHSSNGTPSARLPGGGGSTGSRAAFDRGRIFSSGQQAVRYEKEKRLWKVGPPYGDQQHRFHLPAFLTGLTQFIEHQLQEKGPLGQTLGNIHRNNNSTSTTTTISTCTSLVGGTGKGATAAGEEELEQLKDDAIVDNDTVSLGEFAALALQNNGDEESEIEDNKEENDDVEEEGVDKGKEIESSTSASPSRTWWISTSLVEESLIDAASLPRNAVATREEQEAIAASAATTAAAFAIAPKQRQRQPQQQDGPLELSLRLERLDLTDVEASMLADWAAQHAQQGTAVIRKLWLFGNRLCDDGAAAVARILALGTVNECHLSHNLITLVGAQKLLETVPVGEPAEPAELQQNKEITMTRSNNNNNRLLNPLWLRLEWNRISLSGLVNVLEAQHAQRGLLCDVPEAAREDAAPPLPTLPNYFQSAKEKNNQDDHVQMSSVEEHEEEQEDVVATLPPPLEHQYHRGHGQPNSNSRQSAFTRSTRNQLKFIIEQCHCRLPWVSSQFETPSEAAVLLNAKSLWGSKATDTTGAAIEIKSAEDITTSSSINAGETRNSISSSSNAGTVSNKNKIQSSLPPSTLSASLPPTASSSASSGPLLLIPDTSALLAMAGADPSMTAPTFFTLEWLFLLSTRGLFGRTVPPREQIFIIVPASVATQLDALKSDIGAKSAVRRFMSKGLDDMGPAGANFVTMLGAHEGEGLILEYGAEVAGSRGADVASRGQATDHRIVEVGLYFQQECLKAAVGNAEPAANESGVVELEKEKRNHVSALPVILLTSDNGQQVLAKAHGLPAVRMSDLAAVKSRVLGHVESGKPLTASVLRAALRPAATTALGKVAARSLQMEFDGAVACLRAAVEHLTLAQNRESVLREALRLGAEDADESAELEATRELIEALEKRLTEWGGLIRSHQVASRVLQWSTSTST